MTPEEMKRRWLARTGPLSTGMVPNADPSFSDIMDMPISEEAWQAIPPSEDFRANTAALGEASDKEVLKYLRKRKEELDRQATLKEKLAQQRMPFNVAEGIERIPQNLIGGRYGVPSDMGEGMEEGYLYASPGEAAVRGLTPRMLDKLPAGGVGDFDDVIGGLAVESLEPHPEGAEYGMAFSRYGVPSDKTLGMEEYIPTVPAVRSEIKYDEEGGAAGKTLTREEERYLAETTIEKQAAAIEAAADSGPTPFEDRLNRTLANYGSLADSLPIPSGNPLILKQREELQGKADLWARLRNQNPTPIVFKDRMTAAQTKAAYEQQKDQFLGDVFSMAMPSNIEETNALARAIGADKSSWIDLHNILRQTRADYAYQNQELEFKKAKDQDNVGMVLPSILQELQRDNGGKKPTRTQVLNRLISYSDLYNWPRLASTESVNAATEMYTKLYPATPSTTWYGPDGFESMDVFDNDTAQQNILRGKKWTTQKPGAPAMGQVSTALPQNADVPEDVRKAFIAAKKHFGIRENYKPGYVYPVTINTKQDKKMWNALIAGGARAYDPSKRNLEIATYFGRNEQELSTFDSNNEVARAHYEAAKLRNPGASIEVIAGELAAERYRQSELNQSQYHALYQRQLKAKDLFNMADKMTNWLETDDDAFGFVGEFNLWIQTAMQVGSDVYKSLVGAGVISEDEYAVETESRKLLEDLYSWRSATLNDFDEFGNRLDVRVPQDIKDIQIEQIDMLIADTKEARRGALWDKTDGSKWSFLNRIRTNPRLAQIQLYELGMAAQLARMWVTKDRLLRDIYQRATDATKLRGWQGRDQVAAKLTEVKVIATAKMQEMEHLMNPTLQPVRQRVGEFGGIRDIEGSEEVFAETPIPPKADDLSADIKKRLEEEYRQTYGG